MESPASNAPIQTDLDFRTDAQVQEDITRKKEKGLDPRETELLARIRKIEEERAESLWERRGGLGGQRTH